jgi:hypothetical protein
MILGLALACTDPTPDDTGPPALTTPPTSPLGSTDPDTTPPPPPGHFGPVNEWWHALEEDVPDGLVGTGRGVGDVAYNFTLVDQHGDLVELYQFYGHVIVLDMVAMWASPCADNAPLYEDWIFTEAAGLPIAWLAVIEEGDTGPAADTDAVLWAERHGLNHAVLADTARSELDYALDPYPTLVIIDPSMHIAAADLTPVDFDAILALVP